MIRIRHTVLRTALLTALLAVLAPVPASFAAQHVTQSLTPPPPSFLTCQAAGNGTICHGSRTFTVDPYPDFVCPDGEVIYDQGIVRQEAARYYDTDGNLTQRVVHEFWSDAQKSNPLTGATAPYSQASNITDVLGVPGDFSSATETVTGQANITIPGMGAVLLNAGRTVWAPDGSLDFRAGPQDFLDYFLGNTDVVNKLCAGLGAN
ncbi:MAG TPA: hypothetical protein VGS06_42365 [Streptosporangiaceae bacterium]|nr:hypothetical protein [Streptosporangiaceae bacterium]